MSRTPARFCGKQVEIRDKGRRLPQMNGWLSSSGSGETHVDLGLSVKERRLAEMEGFNTSPKL